MSDRLDSWKAIADYLGRDVRTLRRWEARGFPVRRVAGARGHSVFAYRQEIDEWLRRDGAADAEAPVPAGADHAAPPLAAPMPPPAPLDVVASPSLARPTRRLSRTAVRTATAVAAMVVCALWWRVRAPSAAEEQLTVDVTPAGITARARGGILRWRFDFSPDQIIGLPPTMAPIVVKGATPEVLVATSHAVDRASQRPSSGVLHQFALDGTLRRTFAFDDRWTFGDARTYDAPWVLTSAAVDSAYGRARTAVAAHHYTWWPSPVTLLDTQWHRTGTFVNSGWVESLQWLAPNRLAIGGFNNALDGAMVALLDPDAMNGASPDADPAFQCRNCGDARPVAYIVMPRSELNRVTGGEFNRAILEVTNGALVAHTSEVARPNQQGALIDAIYEFTPELQLISATYSDRYWDAHRALELAGKLSHSRATCPERNGPPFIQMWTPLTGWRTVPTKAPAAAAEHAPDKQP